MTYRTVFFWVFICAPAVHHHALGQQDSEQSDELVETVQRVPERLARSLEAPSHRYALLVVGLPGDEEHRQKFEATIEIWRRWLVQVAGVESQDITLLSSAGEADDVSPATSEKIVEVATQLEKQIKADDSLWVFLLGHGSQDKRHGWFHLPGADLNSAQWAGLFAQLQAKEQVFWLTHAASGSFLKPMSSPGRIVITATDPDGEVNETRFPHALAKVMQRELSESKKDDESKMESKRTSVLELFLATTEQVNQEFAGQQLVPTEHAQLDDNGDGVGTEFATLAVEPIPAAESEEPTEPAQAILDGALAQRVLIRLSLAAQPEATRPAEIDFTPSPTPQ